jgi:hypothetical protein
MSLLLLFGGGGGGTPEVTGTIDLTLGNVTAAISGSFEIPERTGTIAVTLANVTFTTTGAVGNSGTIAITLGNVSSEADTEGIYTTGARVDPSIGAHRLALPPPPDFPDPNVTSYLEMIRSHNQDAFNRLADDLARLKASLEDVAEVASNANFYSNPTVISTLIEGGDITVEAITHEPVAITVFEGSETVTTGDGKAYFRIPAALNGTNLSDAAAVVLAKSTSGTPTIQIARGRQAAAGSAHTFVDMLSTRITIDVNEFDSSTATAARVIDTANDDVLTGDLIRVDVDVAGTGTTGLWVNLRFLEP